MDIIKLTIAIEIIVLIVSLVGMIFTPFNLKLILNAMGVVFVCVLFAAIVSPLLDWWMDL